MLMCSDHMYRCKGVFLCRCCLLESLMVDGMIQTSRCRPTADHERSTAQSDHLTDTLSAGCLKTLHLIESQSLSEMSWGERLLDLHFRFLNRCLQVTSNCVCKWSSALPDDVSTNRNECWLAVGGASEKSSSIQTRFAAQHHFRWRSLCCLSCSIRVKLD